MIKHASIVTGDHVYRIAEGRITRNPIYRFSDIEGISILHGSGNDTVHTTRTSFLQSFNGGDGVDSLFFNGNPVVDSPFRNVSHINFEGQADPSSDSGEVLNTQVDLPNGEPGGPGRPTTENQFNQSQPFDLRPNTLIPVGGGFAAGIFGQAVVFQLDPTVAQGNLPTGIDGVSEAPRAIVFRLSDALTIDAFTEMAAAIDWNDEVILESGDGPFAVDLSGRPPQDVASALRNSLLIAAAFEILNALEDNSGAPLTDIDGVAAMGLFPGQPDQETLANLGDLVGAQSLAELLTALGY